MNARRSWHAATAAAVLASTVVALFLLLLVQTQTQRAAAALNAPTPPALPTPSTSYDIVAVSCGDADNAHRLLVLLKSLLVMGRDGDSLRRVLAQTTFHLYLDERVRPIVERHLAAWAALPAGPRYIVYEPAKEVTLFRECAMERLFMADRLPASVRRVLYLDQDVIAVHPFEAAWARFAADFDAHPDLLMGLAVETEATDAKGRSESWYLTQTAIPYLGVGSNSGVALVDLERMRASGFTTAILQYLDKYGRSARLGDQDLLNAYFHDHPEQLLQLGCEYNQRTDCQPVDRARLPLFVHCNRSAHKTVPWFRDLYLYLAHYPGLASPDN